MRPLAAGGMTMANFSRVNAVADRYGCTTSTIWRWSREPRFSHLGFPKPVKIGPNVTGWAVEELDVWDQRRLAERDEEGMR